MSQTNPDTVTSSTTSVTEGQALSTIISTLGPVTILFRGDEVTYTRYDTQRTNAWRTRVRQWHRTLIWHGEDRTRRRRW